MFSLIGTSESCQLQLSILRPCKSGTQVFRAAAGFSLHLSLHRSLTGLRCGHLSNQTSANLSGFAGPLGVVWLWVLDILRARAEVVRLRQLGTTEQYRSEAQQMSF